MGTVYHYDSRGDYTGKTRNEGSGFWLIVVIIVILFVVANC